MASCFSPLLSQLIEHLQCLPGVGPKSAQRMAFHVLERNRENGKQLAKSLAQAISEISRCLRCRTLSEFELCQLCQQTHRNQNQLCVVENPVDMFAIEQTHCYQGNYFVLMGHLSPLDGIGPEQLGLQHLLARLQNETIEELILATNPTVEGEATAHYIVSLIKDNPIKTTRLAHGVPIGSELEFINGSTLARALESRDLL